jgi:uncharacterized OsmC-like protein
MFVQRSIIKETSVECDLSTAAGGTDCGPTALELSLMALADCGVTIFADVCKKSNIKLKMVEVTAEADKSPDSPIISGVTMKVNASSDARKELLEVLGEEPKQTVLCCLSLRNQRQSRLSLKEKRKN